MDWLLSRTLSPDQNDAAANLSTIAARVKEEDIPTPAIVVVGDMVTLRHPWNNALSELAAASVG